MATLNALNKAPVLNQDGIQITSIGHQLASSDTGVASVAYEPGSGNWWATGVAAGTATLTATRTLDGAVATLEVTVTAAVPFAISLGAESPA